MVVQLDNKQIEFIKDKLIPYLNWLSPEHESIKFIKNVLKKGEYDRWDKDRIDELIESYKIWHPAKKIKV